MAEQKTKPHTGDVGAFLAQIEDETRRSDAHELVELMSEVTGEPPVLWGSIVGFGQYHYKYATGHEGDSCLLGFSPRKAEFSIYLMGSHIAEEAAMRDSLLAKLGKHRMGKACLYVKRLSDIDMSVLRQLSEMSVKTLSETYPATSKQ